MELVQKMFRSCKTFLKRTGSFPHFVWNIISSWCRLSISRRICATPDGQLGQDGDMRSTVRNTTNKKTVSSKQTEKLNRGHHCSSCTIMEKTIKMSTDDLTAVEKKLEDTDKVTLERDTLAIILGKYTHLNEELEYLHERVKEGSVLKSENEKINVKMMVMMEQHQSEVRERDETIKKLNETMENIKSENELLKQEIKWFHDTDEDDSITVSISEEAVEPHSAAGVSRTFQNKKIQLERRITDLSRELGTNNHILRHYEQQLSEFKEKEVDQNDIIERLKCENNVMLECIKKLQEDNARINQQVQEQDEVIMYIDGENKKHLRHIRSLEQDISEAEQMDMKQNEVITRMETKMKNLSSYARKLEYDAIEAEERYLEQDKILEDMESRNKELLDCIKTLSYDNNKAKQSELEQAEMITDLESEIEKLWGHIKKLKYDTDHTKLEEDSVYANMENQIKNLTDYIRTIEAY